MTAKVMLITGATSGIGAAVAREAAHHGYRLAITGRRADRLDALAADLPGVETLALPGDLADPSTPARLIDGVIARYGRLDVLVNNAGFGLPRLFGQTDPARLREQVEVNFTAPIVLARLALPHLIAGKGTIINVGSSITSVANPIFGAYGATKAGLAWWNDALRREVKHLGVKVCLVEPGPVATEFFDAVNRRADVPRPLGTGPPPDRIYNALRDRPPALFTARVDDVARRIVRLVDHPRRRLSVLRRMVWPFRLVGGLFQVWPWLGDLGLSAMVRRIEREEAADGGAP